MSEVAKKSREGSLNISDDVIITIAKLAIKEIDGIYSLEDSSKSFVKFLFGKTSSKPVKVDLNGDVAVINIGVKLVYGCKVMHVAERIQEKIKEAVQSMTGITVAKVNVYITGVTIVDEAND